MSDTTWFITGASKGFGRAAGGGHINQVSSIAGVFSLPGLGLYHASKFGLEGSPRAWPRR